MASTPHCVPSLDADMRLHVWACNAQNYRNSRTPRQSILFMHCTGGHSIRSTQPARLAPRWQSAGRARLRQRRDCLRAPVLGADLLAGGAAQRSRQRGLLLSRWCVPELLKRHLMTSRPTTGQTFMLLPLEWAALGSLGMVRAWQACVW